MNIVCRHLLFSFYSLFMICMVRLINGVMLKPDHISAVVENKSLSCSSAMMVFLNEFNNWSKFVIGYSYCLSNGWSIALKAGFSTVRSGTFSTTRYIATFLDSIFHLSRLRSQELKDWSVRPFNTYKANIWLHPHLLVHLSRLPQIQNIPSLAM